MPAGAFVDTPYEQVNDATLDSWSWSSSNYGRSPFKWALDIDDAFVSPFLRIQGAAGKNAFVVDLSKGDYLRFGNMSNDSRTCDHECDNAELDFWDGTSFPQLHAAGGAIAFDVPSVVLETACFLDLSFGRSDSDDNATYSISDAATGIILASVYLPEWEDDMSPISSVVLPLAGLTTPAVKISWKSGDPESRDALLLSPFMTVRMALGAPNFTTVTTTTSSTTTSTTNTMTSATATTTSTETVTSTTASTVTTSTSTETVTSATTSTSTATSATETVTTTETVTSTSSRTMTSTATSTEILEVSTAAKIGMSWIIACVFAAEGLRNF